MPTLREDLLNAVRQQNQDRVQELILQLSQDESPENLVEILADVLCTAAHFGYENIVSTLLDNGVDYDFSPGRKVPPLFHALNMVHHGVVEMLICAGANVNIVAGLARETPLVIAASNDDLHSVSALLEAGADINQVGGIYRETPLSAAVTRGHTYTVMGLIQAGANVNQIAGHDRATPLQTAIERGYTYIADELRAAGAEIPAVDAEPAPARPAQ